MIFEHRNYIPSFFLFLPLSAGLYSLVIYYSRHNRFVGFSLILFTVFLIVGFGTGTYIRNMTYASSEELWRDALKKAPLSGRALTNLGVNAGWEKETSLNQLQEALALSQRALNSYQQRVTNKTDILMNMGHLLFNFGFYDQAIQQYQRAIQVNPNSADAGYHLAKTHVKAGQFSMAVDRITTVIQNNPPKSIYYNVLGLAHLWMGQPEEGLVAFRNAMHFEKDRQVAYYHVGSALSLSGHYSQALWFLQQARKQERDNIRIALTILENSILSNDASAIFKHARYIFANFDMTTVARALEVLPYELSSVPVDVTLIRPIISSFARKMANSLYVEN